MIDNGILGSSKFNKILGWFHDTDAKLFQLLLELANRNNSDPKYLEVGVFAGKSSIIIGASVEKQIDFYVCDIFENEAEPRNSLEIRDSYANLSRDRFERNYLAFHSSLPSIIQDSSTQLDSYELPEKFCFIHIDGSHLFEIASCDLEFALSRLESSYGFLAVDDWRSPHTVGVSAALWKILCEERAYPLLITDRKIYLTKERHEFLIEKLQPELLKLGLKTIPENFLGLRALRILEDVGMEGFNHKTKLKILIPRAVYRKLIASTRFNKFYQKLRGLK